LLKKQRFLAKCPEGVFFLGNPFGAFCCSVRVEKEGLLSDAQNSRTSLTMPNHRMLKSSTLRTILSQAGISRDDFLKAYDK
jgi:hypothetical protein